MFDGSCLACDHLVGKEGASCFAFLWFVACILSCFFFFFFFFSFCCCCCFFVSLFVYLTLPLVVIGRLSSKIVALP